MAHDHVATLDEAIKVLVEGQYPINRIAPIRAIVKDLEWLKSNGLTDPKIEPRWATPGS